MKNLYKKISAVILAGMVVFGGVAASGVQSFAASSKVIESRSLIGKSSRGFIGDSEQFKKEYEKFIQEVPQKEIKEYEDMIEKIRKAVKNLKVSYHFRLKYVGLPGYIEEKLEKYIKEYNAKYLKNSAFDSADSVVGFLYKYSMFQDKNYIVKIKGPKNKVYKFILYAY